MKKLAQAFNKKSRRVIVLGAAALGFTAGLHTDVLASTGKPETRATEVFRQAAAQPVKVKYAHSQERLDDIEAKMAATPLGLALLDYAAVNNIRVEMSNSRVMDDNPKDNITIKGLNYSTLIRLNGDIKSDDEIMLTLAHEIRHSWHEHTVKSDTLALTPKNEWIKRRIQEADCFAFEIHFAYEYEKATGKTLNIGERNPGAGQQTYASLLGDYARIRAKEGMTVGDAYSQLFARTLNHVQRVGYDKRFTENLKEIWANVAGKPGLRPSYSREMLNPSPDADFIRDMREVATVGLYPGVDPAALTAWQDNDFLGFEKTGGAPAKANMKTFNAAQVKYDEAKKAWQELTAPKLEVPLPPPPGIAPAAPAPG